VRCGLTALVGLVLWTSSAAAGPFTDLVVFGDSLSDIGNLAQAPIINTPGPYYWNGRFSNGPVYAESLATGLGLPALIRSTANGGDFAYGGAKTTGTTFPASLFVQDIDDQVSQFLSARTGSASALYVVFAGANDLIGGQTNMSVPVGSLSTSINRLIATGARQFLVLNLPPLGDTPRYNGSQTTRDQYNLRTQQYNSALAAMLVNVQSGNPAVIVYQFDVFALVNQALVNPAAFGLTNVTNPAAPSLDPGDTSYNTNLIVPNPNQYLFWDDLHPTAAVHAVLAQRALDLFRLPGDFNHDNLVDAADYITWRNGVGTAYIPNDYDVWRAHFGATTVSSSNLPLETAVPEPTTLTLLLIWVIIGIAVRGRRAINNESAVLQFP